MKTLLKVSAPQLPLWNFFLTALLESWPSVWTRTFPTHTYSLPKQLQTKCEAFGFQMLRTLNTMIKKRKTLTPKKMAC